MEEEGDRSEDQPVVGEGIAFSLNSSFSHKKTLHDSDA